MDEEPKRVAVVSTRCEEIVIRTELSSIGHEGITRFLEAARSIR